MDRQDRTKYRMAQSIKGLMGRMPPGQNHGEGYCGGLRADQTDVLPEFS